MLSSNPVRADDPTLVAALTAAGLPTDDIGEPGRSFVRVERDGEVLGYGGYELYGANALIRSVVVPELARGRGNGRAVAEAILAEVSRAGGTHAYLLTTTAKAFFGHLGFTVADRSVSPPAILATRQAASICSSATLTSRAI